MEAQETTMDTSALPDVLRVAIPAGFIAGVLTGVVARLAMRAFAVMTGETPGFSIGGTLFILAVFAVILGIPLAIVYVRFFPTWGGLVYGLAIFAVLIALPFMLIPSEEGTLQMRLQAMAAFFPVAVTYGIALSRVVGRITI